MFYFGAISIVFQKVESVLKHHWSASASFRTLVLLMLGTIYLVLGAGTFSYLEYENELTEKKELMSLERKLRSLCNLSDTEYNLLKSTITKLESHSGGPHWGFAGAFYFAITVVTTIGYGHAVPQTHVGRWICIFYALFGVPLWLAAFQSLGEKVNAFSKKALGIMKEHIGYNKKVTDAQFVVMGLFNCFLALVVGLIAFANFENWSYLDSAYYCLMTLSTIGFGDYVALQEHSALHSNTFYVAFSFMYIMIGLTVFGAFLDFIIRPKTKLPCNTNSLDVHGDKKGDYKNKCKISYNDFVSPLATKKYFFMKPNSFRQVSFESIDELCDQNYSGGDTLNYSHSPPQDSSSQNSKSWVENLVGCLPLRGCCQSPCAIEEHTSSMEKKLPSASSSSCFSKDYNKNNINKRDSLRKGSLPSNDSKLSLFEMSYEESWDSRRSSNISICSTESYQSFDFLQNGSFSLQPTLLLNSSLNPTSKFIIKDFPQCDQKIETNFDQINNLTSSYRHPNFCESSVKVKENEISKSTFNLEEQEQSTSSTQFNSLLLACNDSDKVEISEPSYMLPKMERESEIELISNDNSLDLSTSNEKRSQAIC